MRAHDHRCVWCDAPADDLHHLTGRHPDGSYLDPELVVALCHDDHEHIHDDLRHASLDVPDPKAWSPTEATGFRLGRTALFLARSEHLGAEPAQLLARAMWRWIDDLPKPSNSTGQDR